MVRKLTKLYINDENQTVQKCRELINTVPAKQKVIHYGTKKLMPEVTEEETGNNFSFNSRIENDSNLFEGETCTEDGHDGFKRYRSYSLQQ